MVADTLQLTSAAVAHIREVMAKHEHAVGFRLAVKETGCSGFMYTPTVVDKVNADDIVLEIEGVSIYIDTACIDIIRGTTIDFVVKSLGMKQLEFKNPNAEGLCGCGESFKLKSEAT